jgi:hypothetical protein
MTERETKILQMLIEEFEADGFETFEFKGRRFARVILENGAAVDMTDVDLTRFAEAIARRLR